MVIEKVLEYYIDEQGMEISNPEKNGKGIVIDGETYREGENVKVVIKSDEIYIGNIAKISTMKAGSNKDMVILDESNVSHGIKYEDLGSIERV